MAKMFYTLTETAEKLGVKEADVRALATSGKLQQFRDRDKLMFKREQVDSLASARKEDSQAGDLGVSSGAIPLDDTGLSTGEIPMGAKSGDQIDLAIDDADLPGAKKGKSKNEDSRMATGISVFDANEIEEADPHTQTIVKPVDDEEELALESVGSGSGLLDLTQESDDTSLGAELLDEIYPGGEGSDAKVQSPAGSSGAFEPAGIGSGSSGLEYAAAGGGGTVVVEAIEEEDPAGNGMAIGMLVVALAVIVVGLMVALSTVTGEPLAITNKLAGAGGAEDKTPMYFAVGGIVGAIVLGAIGFFVGNGQKKK